jgi:hypothetical protein
MVRMLVDDDDDATRSSPPHHSSFCCLFVFKWIYPSSSTRVYDNFFLACFGFPRCFTNCTFRLGHSAVFSIGRHVVSHLLLFSLYYSSHITTVCFQGPCLVLIDDDDMLTRVFLLPCFFLTPHFCIPNSNSSSNVGLIHIAI